MDLWEDRYEYDAESDDDWSDSRSLRDFLCSLDSAIRDIGWKGVRERLLAGKVGLDIVESIDQYYQAVEQAIQANKTAHKYRDDEVYSSARYWKNQQMMQLGSAASNCPPSLLATVISAAAFLIHHHPNPLEKTFYVYKKFSQSDGHVHIGGVIEQMRATHVDEANIKALLYLPMIYGEALGSAYLTILNLACHLTSYEGGIGQLVSDLVTAKIPPTVQEDFIYQIAWLDNDRNRPMRKAIKGLIRLYQLNPDAVYPEFRICGGARRFYDAITTSDPTEQAAVGALANSTAETAIPKVSQQHRSQSFGVLLSTFKTPHQQLFADTFDVVTASEDSASPVIMDNALSQLTYLVQIATDHSRASGERTFKGPWPTATELGEDILALAKLPNPRTRARWYDTLLPQGLARAEIMPVITLPLTDGMPWKGEELSAMYKAFADDFIAGSEGTRERYLPFARLLVAEAGYYHFAQKMGEDPQPDLIICRYIFGVGPIEEEGLGLTTVALCERILNGNPIDALDLKYNFERANEVMTKYPAFGQRLRFCIRQTTSKIYHELIGEDLPKSIPVELIATLFTFEEFTQDDDFKSLLRRFKSAGIVKDSVMHAFSRACQIARTTFPEVVTQIHDAEAHILARQDAFYSFMFNGHNLLANRQSAQMVGHLDQTTSDVQIARQLWNHATHKIEADAAGIERLVPARLPRRVAIKMGTLKSSKIAEMLGMLAESWQILDEEQGDDDDLAPAWDYILRSRIARPGYLPLGAKLHVDKAVDLALVDAFIGQFGIGTSPFSTIHAGKTLLFRPGTAEETKLYMLYLKKKGLFDDRNFDMQTCLPGRLKPRKHNATERILGATMLLATEATPHYAVDAWSTKTQNSKTNAYIMAYGDGIRLRNLPYDINSPGCRTDMLGRRHLNDLDLYQKVGTPLMHFENGGYFSDLGENLIRRVSAILDHYKLLTALYEAPWIFDPKATVQTADMTTLKHWQMISKFTNARIVAEERDDKGITGEVRAVIQDTFMESAKRFPAIIRDNPDQFEKLCTL